MEAWWRPGGTARRRRGTSPIITVQNRRTLRLRRAAVRKGLALPDRNAGTSLILTAPEAQPAARREDAVHGKMVEGRSLPCAHLPTLDPSAVERFRCTPADCDEPKNCYDDSAAMRRMRSQSDSKMRAFFRVKCWTQGVLESQRRSTDRVS